MPRKSNAPGCENLWYFNRADANSDLFSQAMRALNKSKHAKRTVRLNSDRYEIFDGKLVGILTFDEKTQKFGLTTPSRDGCSRNFDPF
jgi:hypothetical protein